MTYYVGLDVGGTSIKGCVADEKGQIIHWEEIPSEAHLGGSHVLEKMTKMIRSFKKRTTFSAIGISTAGQVDVERGRILYANENIPRYTGMEVQNILEEIFDVPVRVENDVNAAALGEKDFGAAKDLSDFFCVTYGTGIGGAIFIEDQLYRGRNGSAGEFGHMMAANGIFYEEVASVRALVEEAKKADPTVQNGRTLMEKILNKDWVLEQILDDWLDQVSAGLVSLIHIFNPTTLLIGGGLMEQPMVIECLSKKVAIGILDSFAPVDIRPAALGNKAGALGAVSLVRGLEQRKIK